MAHDSNQDGPVPIELVRHLRTDDASLLKASAWGMEDEVKMLLIRGANANTQDTRRSTALHYACDKGHAAVVQILLKEGAQPDIKDNNGCTALHLAICSSSPYWDSIKHLVESGANIESQDKLGRTPLHLAAIKSRTMITRYLLRRGAAANRDTRDKDGLTPLICAAIAGSGSIVKMLLRDYGTSIEAADIAGRMSLCWAARKGHDTVVETLLRWKPNIDHADAKGKTALMWAAAGGHASTIHLLQARGANINAVNREGITALHWAAGRGYDEVVDDLVHAGARVGAQDSSQRTALSWAAEMGRDSTIQLLLQRGADADSIDRRGFRPLHWAAHQGRDGTAGALLDGGAKIEAGDLYGNTALHWAATMNRVSTVRLLLQRRAQVDATSSCGETPLHWAAEKGRNGVITALVRGGADLEARYLSSGWTALHSVVAAGHSSTVKLLLDSRANVYATTANGETAADIATTREVRSLLTACMGTITSSRPFMHFLSEQTGLPAANGSNASVEKAREWLWRAQKHIRSMKRDHGIATRRIKVAVIDTGVDLDNQDILPHETRIHFSGAGPRTTKTVAESRDSLDLSENRIKELAEGIVEAAREPGSVPSASGNMKAKWVNAGIDILNLSFGIPDPDEPKLDPLRLAQIHTINHVLILAASCNNGGNTGVMWPASERCVICVNSSDGRGKPSDFNPTQPSPKFCTLGEGLELRLTKGQMEAVAKKMRTQSPVPRDRVESGTSFATPIAVALVATILDFVDTNPDAVKLTENDKQRLKKLRTQHGMLQVFKERCVESSLATRDGYYYIAPHFFSLEPTNMHLILDTLRRA